ncbi:MAG: pilin [bacterium]|nr:pilin [bacterium]
MLRPSKSRLRLLVSVLLPGIVVLAVLTVVFRGGLSNLLTQTLPQYDVRIGTSTHDADSIDDCLRRKKWHFNELYNIHVNGLARCERNAKGLLSVASESGVSTDPVDEERCRSKREGQIVSNGVPSENAAELWSRHCSYLGALGGAGRPSSSSTRTSSDFFSFSSSSGGSRSLGTPATSSTGGAAPDGSTADTESSTGPLYDGVGVSVPDASLVAGGISKEKSLIVLIIGFTNWLLPFVSVLSVFAFVAAGLFYILTFANEELNSKAKNIMLYVVIGIVIIFSAYTIVNTLLSLTQ